MHPFCLVPGEIAGTPGKSRWLRGRSFVTLGGMATEAPIRSRPRSGGAFAPAGEFWTDDEIMALPDDHGQRYELWNGEIIVMSPAGASHNHVETRLVVALYQFAETHRLGQVYSGDTGFRLSPLVCYAPDVAFVTRARLRGLLPNPEKFLQGAPDLAVEVLSTDDSLRRTQRKIADYFHHGTVAAWLVLPRRRQVRVYHSAQDYVTLEGNEATLTGGTLLPGFEYPLDRLFVDPAFD